MPLKDHVPFTAKHRAKLAAARVSGLPRHLASGSVRPRNRAHRAYQGWYRTRQLARFFRPLLEPGDLVFDVGANVGVWTDGLVAAGARVVAVEPQPACAAAIAGRFAGDPRVTVVEAAVGAEAGEAELLLAPDSEHATLARDWVDDLVERGAARREYWTGAIRVPVRTLDDLVEELGLPAYVKLDVEGAEPAALAGLSRPVRLLSFEIHGQTPEATVACTARVEELGAYEFNLTPGEFPRLEWPEWRSGEAVLAAATASRDGWSNVFARRRT